jgi:hypothetical protein
MMIRTTRNISLTNPSDHRKQDEEFVLGGPDTPPIVKRKSFISMKGASKMFHKVFSGNVATTARMPDYRFSSSLSNEEINRDKKGKKATDSNSSSGFMGISKSVSYDMYEKAKREHPRNVRNLIL